ncbi:MAG: hypothetical protein JXM73_12515 [Anaerolineae bacterium]|nr:hypothetical protein [Anaerolineae bacterium]
MIRKWMTPVFLILALAIAGCGSSGKTASDTAATSLTEDYADALSIRSQLVLGTLKLEETGLAVTTAQAADLLPLWQAARSLTRSGTGATEETDAVLKQIQETMTPEQLEAIAALRLTRADTQAMAQAMGLLTGTGEGAAGGRGQGQNLSAEERATRQAERETSSSVGTSEALLDRLIETLEMRAK